MVWCVAAKKCWNGLVLALLWAWGAQAQAGPVACGDKPIRLAFYEAGYFYFNEKQHAQGIDKDIVDELARRTGCKFDALVMARARIWADLASGSLDMSVSGIENPERTKFAWFAPYLSLKNQVVVRAASAAQVTDAQSFLKQPALLFGAVRSFKHGVDQDKWLDMLRDAKRVHESVNVETLFKKLKEGRIDALYSQAPVYAKNLADLGMDKDVVVQDWTPTERGVPLGLILAKSRFQEADANAWRAVVEELRKDSTLKRIYTQYLGASTAAAMLNF